MSKIPTSEGALIPLPEGGLIGPSEVFEFTAQSHQWKVTLSRDLTIKQGWLFKFVMWLMPRLGIHVRFWGNEYGGVKFTKLGIEHDCMLDFEIRHDCETIDSCSTPTAATTANSSST